MTVPQGELPRVAILRQSSSSSSQQQEHNIHDDDDDDDDHEFAEISMKHLKRVTSSEGLLNDRSAGQKSHTKKSYGFQQVHQHDHDDNNDDGNDEEERFDDEEVSGEDMQLLIDDAIGMYGIFIVYVCYLLYTIFTLVRPRQRRQENVNSGLFGGAIMSSQRFTHDSLFLVSSSLHLSHFATIWPTT